LRVEKRSTGGGKKEKKVKRVEKKGLDRRMCGALTDRRKKRGIKEAHEKPPGRKGRKSPIGSPNEAAKKMPRTFRWGREKRGKPS